MSFDLLDPAYHNLQSLSNARGAQQTVFLRFRHRQNAREPIRKKSRIIRALSKGQNIVFVEPWSRYRLHLVDKLVANMQQGLRGQTHPGDLRFLSTGQAESRLQRFDGLLLDDRDVVHTFHVRHDILISDAPSLDPET